MWDTHQTGKPRGWCSKLHDRELEQEEQAYKFVSQEPGHGKDSSKEFIEQAALLIAEES